MTNRTHTIHRNITGTCPTLMNAWKNGKLQNTKLRIWHVVKKLNSKTDALKIFSSKSCFLKNQNNGNTCRFYGVKRVKTWCFESTFSSKSDTFKNFQCRNWHVKSSCQNLRRCKNFNSKSDALLKSWMKFWRVVKVSVQNLTRRKTCSPKSDLWTVFQVLTGGSYLL